MTMQLTRMFRDIWVRLAWIPLPGLDTGDTFFCNRKGNGLPNVFEGFDLAIAFLHSDE